MVIKEHIQESPSISNWIYLDTLYYDTKTQGDIQSLVIGMLSFLPYVGPVFAIASMISVFQSLGHPTMYVKTLRYYASGYRFYKYDSYFYSNPERTNLINTTSEIKQMW